MEIKHEDVIQWRHFPRYWPFVRGIHQSPENSPHKCQWHGALMFSLICTWTNSWVHNQDTGDLWCHLAHYDIILMQISFKDMHLTWLSAKWEAFCSKDHLHSMAYNKHLGLYSLGRPFIICIGITITDLRCLSDHCRSIMGIPTPVIWHLFSGSRPWVQIQYKDVVLPV